MAHLNARKMGYTLTLNGKQILYDESKESKAEQERDGVYMCIERIRSGMEHYDK